MRGGEARAIEFLSEDDTTGGERGEGCVVGVGALVPVLLEDEVLEVPPGAGDFVVLCFGARGGVSGEGGDDAVEPGFSLVKDGYW